MVRYVLGHGSRDKAAAWFVMDSSGKKWLDPRQAFLSRTSGASRGAKFVLADVFGVDRPPEPGAPAHHSVQHAFGASRSVYIPRIESSTPPPPAQINYDFGNRYWTLPKNFRRNRFPATSELGHYAARAAVNGLRPHRGVDVCEFSIGSWVL